MNRKMRIGFWILIVGLLTARAADAVGPINVTIPGGSGYFSTNITFNVGNLGALVTLNVQPSPCYHFTAQPNVSSNGVIEVTQNYGECAASYGLRLVGGKQASVTVSGSIAPGGCGCTGGGGTPPPADSFTISVLDRLAWIKFTDPANGTNLTTCAGSTNNVAVQVTLGDAGTPSSGTVTFSSGLGTFNPSGAITLVSGAASAQFIASANGGSGTITATANDLPDGLGGTISGVATTITAAAVKLQSLTITAGATQIDATNWAAVKAGASDFVTLEATLNPNTDEAASLLTWTGGDAVSGHPRQRQVSKATSAKTTVTASCCNTSMSENVWIIWSTVVNQTTGTTPANAVQFGTRYDGTENLGAQSFNGGSEAVGKVVPIATITPAGIHAVVTNGWAFKREKFRRDWLDGAHFPGRWDSDWSDDTSDPSFQNLTPDADDKIYDRDAPNIVGTGATDSVERYDNYREWVQWNGTDCSTKAGWYWKAWWKIDQNPQVTLKEVAPGQVTQPSTSHYPPP